MILSPRLLEAAKQALVAIEEELYAAGPDEVRQHPVLRQHRKVANALRAAVAEAEAALAAPSGEPERDETGWVLVRDVPGNLAYWAGYGWEAENLKAVRFARQEDADRVRSGFNMAVVRVEEHRWMAP